MAMPAGVVDPSSQAGPAAAPRSARGVSPPPSAAVRGFERLAWGVLAYTLVVILFGAVVRITGSGAGCGQHWPTCQGEIAHLPRSAETAIELTHRVTSGLSLLAVVGLVVAARRRFGPGHAVRRHAWLALAFMVVESLVGAALVLLELVGKNASLARAAVMAVHLVNTSLLTAVLALTAWCATRPAPRRWWPGRSSEWPLALGLLCVLVISMTGAVTALGDTLYPVEAGVELATRVAHDQGASAHLLERGRAIHPLLAVSLGVYLLRTLAAVREEAALPGLRRAALAVLVLVLAQLGAGVINIWLMAPGWMQVVHLAIGTLLWLALVLTWARSATQSQPRELLHTG